ncbi:AraC family transcriptional regulator [Winogradskyella maritima]|uniref:Helix-turn-helix domain-containing protein n=1 Tax=Winogradskyella maritima TaxID=1517766 RepID=A0ABV8ANG8_9FLAO|nr:AraC family transcriptional regulator [Winogradskyella maritima]
MNTYHIDLALNQPYLEQLNFHLNGELTSSQNEVVLTFNNSLGKGKVQATFFNKGMALYRYQLQFIDDTEIICSGDASNPLAFIYMTAGSISYNPYSDNVEPVSIEQYQNCILRNNISARDIFIFQGQTTVELTIVKVVAETFIQHKNLEISTINDELKDILVTPEEDLPLVHLGNFNLGLKDMMAKPASIKMSPSVRQLDLESKCYRIIATQLSDYQKSLQQNSYPNFISKSDLIRLKAISDYISENINEFKTVAELCSKYGYTQRKLQAMFRLYHGMSINSFVKLKKMEMARDLIENSNYSISEIVYQIGYKSRSYFSKLFFDSYGILPMKYREKFKKQAQSFQRKKR